MTFHRGLPLIALALTTLAGPGLARAATANCMSMDGTCEVSNDGFDWIECMCTDGSGGGGGGGNMWAGLTEMELIPICEEQLASFCGPFVPPDYVECWGLLGSCIIDNEPEDELSCDCLDGSTGGMSGGMAWAGLDDAQLAAECEVQLDMHCMAPPGSVVCTNPNGECTIANVPSDLLACECVGGDYGSMGGGNAWAGYSELELHNECGNQLVGFCGGPLPPPPWVECSSRLGACIIDNDPEDLLECTCTDGTEINDGGGSEWAGLSQDELFQECEEQLYEGCWVGVGSDSGTDTGDTGTTGDPGGTGSTSSTSSTGGDTSVDGSGGSEGSSGTPPPAGTTTGDDTTGDAPEVDDGGSGGGCSCAESGGSTPGGWALALLGLFLGAGRGRRRYGIR